MTKIVNRQTLVRTLATQRIADRMVIATRKKEKVAKKVAFMPSAGLVGSGEYAPYAL